jgi:hypothetical protein
MAAKASFTAAKRGGQTPWMSGRVMGLSRPAAPSLVPGRGRVRWRLTRDADPSSSDPRHGSTSGVKSSMWCEESAAPARRPPSSAAKRPCVGGRQHQASGADSPKYCAGLRRGEGWLGKSRSGLLRAPRRSAAAHQAAISGSMALKSPAPLLRPEKRSTSTTRRPYSRAAADACRAASNSAPAFHSGQSAVRQIAADQIQQVHIHAAASITQSVVHSSEGL